MADRVKLSPGVQRAAGFMAMVSSMFPELLEEPEFEFLQEEAPDAG